MRRILWVLAIVLSCALFLAGCGQKDATSVVKDLDQKMSKLESYAGIGTMTLYSGQQPLEYQVEVWYQNPSYYRIELKNAKKDVSQIVLRNDEGVFVLTPSLKKSFRFQSDWPDNQGQVYLYQTLIHSILADKAPQFTEEGDSFVFEVAANYQTDSLVRQKIWLDQQSYAPKQVQVTDAESRVVVEMKFKQFDFSKKFEKDAFDMQRNMTASANIDPQPQAQTKQPADSAVSATDSSSAPASTGVATETPAVDGEAKTTTNSTDGSTEPATNDATKGTTEAPTNTATKGSNDTPAHTAPDGAATTPAPTSTEAVDHNNHDAKAPETAPTGKTAGNEQVPAVDDQPNTDDSGGQDEGSPLGPFGFIEPSYTPTGVELGERVELPDSKSHAVMMRYTGTYTYSIMEERPEDVEVGIGYSEGVNLGFTVAHLIGEEQKSMTWLYDGIKYRITSGDLPLTEMIKIAQSMVDQSGK
ncbi:outer membrane lipoprotein-sorting protein [Paenibacillus assamensis]|uniref:outer membrane lipoprotein-sorting protein n=1 Tax=Paenibacillus assamensis TaxID=311244 RepID=UPI0004130D90|nr:outer membrane lipoprotein-sorting protein [Paenibacillus assamensis]